MAGLRGKQSGPRSWKKPECLGQEKLDSRGYGKAGHGQDRGPSDLRWRGCVPPPGQRGALAGVKLTSSRSDWPLRKKKFTLPLG